MMHACLPSPNADSPELPHLKAKACAGNKRSPAPARWRHDMPVPAIGMLPLLKGLLGPCSMSRQPRASRAQAESEVTVWSEVVPPFTLMPREALQAAGNTVLAGVMRTLLPLFLRRRAGAALVGTTLTQGCLHKRGT